MSHRIVVCDDEAHITRAISMKLTKAGFDVETAPDGQAGWEAVQREQPDMVITDYQMPRLDGIELSRRLQQDPATRSLPIILLTAKGFELDEEQLQAEAPSIRLFVKPFSPRELLDCVRELLERSETVDTAD